MPKTLDPVVPTGVPGGFDASEYNGQVPVQRSGVESMFSNRKSPWHEIGVVIPDAVRSTDVETILKTAGMDWTVSKRPLRVASNLVEQKPEAEDAAPLKVWEDFTLGTEDFSAMVRDDTNTVLGVVKKAYAPFQNVDALDLLNDILLSGDVTVETAGVLWGGRRVWLLANIPKELTVEGDLHVPYLCVSTTHDGSGSVRADLTLMRVECQNSLRWAIRNPHLLEEMAKAGITNPSPSWTHRHSRNVKTKAADARRILGFAGEFIDAYSAEIEAMMARVLKPREFDKMLTEFVTEPDQATDRQKRNVGEKREKVRALYESERDGGRFKGTGWGAFQAFSSYDLWGSDLREGEQSRPRRQVARLLDGTIEKRNSAVRDRLLGR